MDDYHIDNNNEYNVSMNNNIIPPDPPNIEGPINCKIWEEYNYNFTISHPEGIRLVSLFVIFGDGTNLTKNYQGSSCCKGWRSGYTIHIRHEWKESGNYSIKAKVKDYPGIWSDWGGLEISVVKEKNSNYFNSCLLRSIQRFPIEKY
jgi:hypothetical protein